jgi:hypothetical protein
MDRPRNIGLLQKWHRKYLELGVGPALFNPSGGKRRAFDRANTLKHTYIAMRIINMQIQ